MCTADGWVGGWIRSSRLQPRRSSLFFVDSLDKSTPSIDRLSKISGGVFLCLLNSSVYFFSLFSSEEIDANGRMDLLFVCACARCLFFVRPFFMLNRIDGDFRPWFVCLWFFGPIFFALLVISCFLVPADGAPFPFFFEFRIPLLPPPTVASVLARYTLVVAVQQGRFTLSE